MEITKKPTSIKWINRLLLFRLLMIKNIKTLFYVKYIIS